MAVKKVTEATQNETDPWKRMYSIRIPRAAIGQDNFIFASVNEHNYKIKRGEDVEVPEPIYEVIKNSFDAKDAADDFVEATRK